jgi:putative FmdB family regulatory protein
MPLYEYQCDRCGKTFELIQKFTDAPLTVHEGCGGAVVRLLSAPALQFKGTGWYVTDYAKGGHSPAGNGKSEGKGKSDGKAEGKSDSKPESKSTSSSSTSSETK